MPKRSGVDSETVRFQADDGTEAIRLHVSRIGIKAGAGLVIRSSSARAVNSAVHTGHGRSSSLSHAAAGPAGSAAEAAVAGTPGHRLKLSD